MQHPHLVTDRRQVAAAVGCLTVGRADVPTLPARIERPRTVAVVGDRGAGKSELIAALTGVRSPVPAAPLSVAWLTNARGDRIVALHELSAGPRDRRLRQISYQVADTVLVLTDLTRAGAVSSARRWMDEAALLARASTRVIVAGTKIDARAGQAVYRIGSATALVSAQSKAGIDRLRSMLGLRARRILENYRGAL